MIEIDKEIDFDFKRLEDVRLLLKMARISNMDEIEKLLNN